MSTTDDFFGLRGASGSTSTSAVMFMLMLMAMGIMARAAGASTSASVGARRWLTQSLARSQQQQLRYSQFASISSSSKNAAFSGLRVLASTQNDSAFSSASRRHFSIYYPENDERFRQSRNSNSSNSRNDDAGLVAAPLPTFLNSTNSNSNSNQDKFEQLVQSLWLAMEPKIPKGFENFFPKGKQGEGKEAGDAESSSSSSSNTDKPKIDLKKSSFRSKNDKNAGGSGNNNNNNNDNKNNNNGNKPPYGDDPQTIPAMLTLLLLVIAARQFMSESESGEFSKNGQEINFVQFRNELLDAGQVEKIEVVNKSIARVILHPGSKGISSRPLSSSSATTFSTSMAHSHSNSSSSRHQNQQHQLDETTMDFSGASSTNADGSALVRSSKPSDRGLVYHFHIGSVDSFEEKLSKAQDHIDPKEWIPVQYINEVNLMAEFFNILPTLLFLGAIFYFGRNMLRSAGMGGAGAGGGPGGIFQIGKSNAKKINPESVKVNFNDVAGCQQAKLEIMEFVDFLKDSRRFTKLGAKIPKGALLCGPPGTGKTLLAKAVAGEAGVPFYSISGSDFIEMFVGVGPSRVRDLFKEARNNSPCIVFIDEIDAVGRQRGRGGMSGGNDERENTLNQLLVEMDGFTPSTGVVVLGGTNRVDILDQALTRPGRFDRQITVDRPDLQGRKEIFHVHLKGITLEGEADEYAGRLAGLTPGFAGADIANICNEAAIVAARRKGESVTLEDFEKATDRIIGGLESNKIMSKHEREIVAHHEAGHAVAGWFLEHADPLLKVTIIPRSSGALGFAQYLPKEVFLRTQEQIMDIVCMALAGRAAEEVFFGRVTTGASDDLKRVTQLVYSTIQTYGMNSRVGQLAFQKQEGEFEKPYSEATAETMDDEARSIVDEAYRRTVNLIREHKDDVDKIAKLLMEKETIAHDDMIDTIGERPFEGDTQYKEYVSHRFEVNRKAAAAAAAAEAEKKKDDEEEVDNTGAGGSGDGPQLTPGLN
eukprot:CAMPEP_0119547582 /NCGR_PEP_ID=MMETSP1352-20130426/1658_1 /TAXON_ID=265584 /ORGANISM="Stauroneis constricta, Strain CCMP1120" /LENGTH=988 /DNA_ID=CAMNT_0007592531 /DNA_START=189 /DNA_END=3155 /DNA_ORIENTATION=-